MRLNECYTKAYCYGESLTDAEVVEFLVAYKKAADVLVQLGEAFNITFKETNRCYLWLESIADARKLVYRVE